MNEQCPSDEDLAAFAEGNVLPEERPRIEGHLARCSTCREIVTFVVQSKEESVPPKQSGE
jgi:anti-sigma factor ChrR (cupin superfamily)